MIILKFGGTSVSSKDCLETICEVVKNESGPIIVVSAIRGVTDLLFSCIDTPQHRRKATLQKIKKINLDLAKDCLPETKIPKVERYIDEAVRSIEKILSRNTKNAEVTDQIVSIGEKISSLIIQKVLENREIFSAQVLATELIVTDNNFSQAEFLPRETKIKTRKKILPLLRKGIVPVVTGFIGSTKEGRTTTLGRGGSDYTAAILGFSLSASEIQIWTDVDGIHSADPKIIKNTKVLEKITFKEASELAAFGAKVLHPRTIRPALTVNIPVTIKNTFNPKTPGTQIVAQEKSIGSRIISIASKKDITLVNIYSSEMLYSKGFLEKIFAIFAESNISVDLVSVSEVSVSVTLDNNDNLESALQKLNKFTKTTHKKAGLVSIIGHNILGVKYLTRDIFSVLEIANIPIFMISMGASDINISLVVDKDDVDMAVKILHTALIDRRYRKERMYI